MSPSCWNASICDFVVGSKRMSMVFKLVPASLPFKPFCANTASAVLVSSNDMPTPAATEETADKAYFSS